MTSRAIFILALCLTLTRTIQALSPPVSIQEELGSSPTLSRLLQRDGGVFFDPLGFATDDNFARYREAELKHGRVAMVAVVAACVQTGVAGGRLSEPPSLYHLFNDYWTISGFIKFVLVCGVLEVLLLVQIDPQDMPGDYGLGYFGVRDKGKHERSLVCELENGRLAMLVMLYYALTDLVSEPLYGKMLENLVARTHIV